MSSHIDCTYRVSPAHIVSCKAKVRISENALLQCLQWVCRADFILNVISQRLHSYSITCIHSFNQSQSMDIMKCLFAMCAMCVCKTDSIFLSSHIDCSLKVSPINILSCKVKVKIRICLFAMCTMCVCKTDFILNVISHRLHL